MNSQISPPANTPQPCITNWNPSPPIQNLWVNTGSCTFFFYCETGSDACKIYSTCGNTTDRYIKILDNSNGNNFGSSAMPIANMIFTGFAYTPGQPAFNGTVLCEEYKYVLGNTVFVGSGTFRFNCY